MAPPNTSAIARGEDLLLAKHHSDLNVLACFAFLANVESCLAASYCSAVWPSGSGPGYEFILNWCSLVQFFGLVLQTPRGLGTLMLNLASIGCSQFVGHHLRMLGAGSSFKCWLVLPTFTWAAAVAAPDHTCLQQLPVEMGLAFGGRLAHDVPGPIVAELLSWDLDPRYALQKAQFQDVIRWHAGPKPWLDSAPLDFATIFGLEWFCRWGRHDNFEVLLAWLRDVHRREAFRGCGRAHSDSSTLFVENRRIWVWTYFMRILQRNIAHAHTSI